MLNKISLPTLVLAIFIALSSHPFFAQESTPFKNESTTFVGPTKENYLKFADEAEHMLRQDILGKWFPACVDNVNGGFNASFDRQWKTGKSEGKFSVFQGRMTWVASQVVMRRPDLKEQYLPIVHH